MAFRSQKTIGALVILLVCVSLANGEQITIPVRHRHLRQGTMGEIRVGESAISFQEGGKKPKHSREWAYEDIQQLLIAADSLRILTYEDVDWQLGRDRRYEFDQLPEGAAQKVLDAIRGHIDERRLVAALPDHSIIPLWQVKAKLVDGRGGSEGIVLVGVDSIVYNSEERNASRTWHFAQIENISSSGPFDLTITTFERDGSRFADRRDFRFQLKTELLEERYNTLWRRLSKSRLTHSLMSTEVKEKPNE
ncbi:MAG: hypothetical protein ABJF23_24630 [Bryobacteraceae bacterium]